MTRPRGPLPDWQPTSKRQKAILNDAVEQYRRLDEDDLLPRSTRGIFYDLRPDGHGHGVEYLKRQKVNGKLPPLGPMEADPNTVQEVLVLARRAGIIDEGWVADARAPDPLTPAAADDADSEADRIGRYLDSLRLDRQAGQDRFVEVWCEAEGLGARLARIAEGYGVPVYPAGGFAGLKGKRAAGQRVAACSVPTVVLHVGDYDQHGKWIFRSEAEDVAAWAVATLDGEWARRDDDEEVEISNRDGAWLTVVRLAVTEAQVAEGLVELDDDGKAEAEAIPPAELDRIVREALDGLLDPARREQVVAGEADMRSEVARVLTGRWAQ